MKKYKPALNLRPGNIVIVLFLAGFVLGMVFAFLSQNNSSDLRYQWLDSAFMYLKYGELDYGNILFYVLKKRIGLILLLILICLTGKGKYILTGGVALAGGFCGFFITEFIRYKGILGSGLFFATIFPHYICYIYGYYVLIGLLFRKRTNNTGVDQYGQYNFEKVSLNNRGFIKKYAPIAVVIIGMLLECYVNPFFVKIFLKIFM